MDGTVDFQALVWAMGDAVIGAARDGTILLWNPAAERMFGFTAQEALGRSLDLIIPERFRTRHWEGYREVMRTGRTRYGADVLRVPALHKDKRTLSIAFTVALVRSRDNEIHMIVAIVRDETARWKEDRALRQRLTELEAAVQMKTSAADIAGHSSGAKLNFGALRPFRDSSPMKTHLVKLSGREVVAEGTMAFRFEKPEGFSFEPGQAVCFELVDRPSGVGQSHRAFSLVSAPFENTLVVATRMRDSAFKRGLKALPDGASIKLEGPFGELTLHDDTTRPAVFIAGGIGITPFISVLRQAAKDGLPHRLFLIYSNRRPEEAPFLDELQGLEQQSKNFRLLATMTDMMKSARKWDGQTRRINADMVKRFVGDLVAPIYYVVGPPAMVKAMQGVLRETGVAEDSIRTEEFYGY